MKVFKEIGLADELGSGFRNMIKYTKIYSGGVPEMKEDDIFRTIIPLNTQESEQVMTKSNDQVATKLNDQEIILDFCKQPRKFAEIMEIMGYKHKNTFRKKYVLPLLESGKLKMTIPDKPNSSKQKYISK